MTSVQKGIVVVFGAILITLVTLAIYWTLNPPTIDIKYLEKTGVVVDQDPIMNGASIMLLYENGDTLIVQRRLSVAVPVNVKTTIKYYQRNNNLVIDSVVISQ